MVAVPGGQDVKGVEQGSLQAGARRPGAARDRMGRWATNPFSVGKSHSDVLALCLSFGDFQETLLLSMSRWRINIAEKR
jgi:hypothetical protein